MSERAIAVKSVCTVSKIGWVCTDSEWQFALSLAFLGLTGSGQRAAGTLSSQ
jgi:hypothetical protein